MQKGEVYQQEAKDGFEILIGDAGTFRYSINDRPGRVVGESGDVIVARINRAHPPELARARALTAHRSSTVCGIR